MYRVNQNKVCKMHAEPCVEHRWPSSELFKPSLPPFII